MTQLSGDYLMKINACLLILLIVFGVNQSVPAMAQLVERSEPVKLIRRVPHLENEPEGEFTVKFDRSNNRLVIDGRVSNLSSPLFRPAIATTEIHLHHFQMMDQSKPPIIENLAVNRDPDEKGATFSGDFTLDTEKEFEKMFLAGMTFVLVHTENNPGGEVVGYIDFGDDSAALQWGDSFQNAHPLIRQFREVNQNPVLPISRSKTHETDDSPFPAWGVLKDNPQFLDTRSGTGDNSKKENERYLRKPVGHVTPDGVIKKNNVETDKHSFFDHPNVQSRPFRPMHLRYAGNLENVEILAPHPGDALQQEFDAKYDSVTRDVGYDPQQVFSHLPSQELAPQGPITYADTPPAMYPEVDPIKTPPGTNLLPTIYENMRDRQGNEMINTLPSHPNRPYNLHDEEPEVTRLETPGSPTDDLRLILDDMYEAITGSAVRRHWEQLELQTLEEIFRNVSDEGHRRRFAKHRDRLLHHTEWAIDILEGNEGKTINPDGTGRPSRVAGNRAYRGFALLHHSGHKRATRVMPVYDGHGKIVAGHVDVRQIWYDGRVESDTAFYDYGWDDIPIRVQVDDHYETRWYSSTDPALTRELWDCSRDKTVCSEQQVGELTPTPHPIPHNVPLYATFEVSVLNRGEDDFSMTIVHFDAHEKLGGNDVPWGKLNIDGKNTSMGYGPPHFGMDATFFPLQEGTRTKIKLKLSDAEYHNVHYTWGWRKHPPRAQAVENMHKRIPPASPEFKNVFHVMWDHPSAERFFDKAIHKGMNVTPRLFRLRIDDHERFVFDGFGDIDLVVERYLDEEMIRFPARDGEEPGGAAHRQRIRTKLRKDFERLTNLAWMQPPQDGNPINKIGDLAPAKQMWKSFHSIREMLIEKDFDPHDCLHELLQARNSYLDWKDRNHLPTGLKIDPDADLTMLYANNTLYGELKNGSPTRLGKWRTRGTNVKITLINSDYFIHGYANPDFGGLRGYENQFKPTLAIGGQGSLFTFGRFNWRFNVVGGVVPVPPAHMEERVEKTGDGESGFEWKQIEPFNVRNFAEQGPDNEKRYRVVPGVHRVMIRYNYEPSRRLRFYQFDPLHHDVAIYSIH